MIFFTPAFSLPLYVVVLDEPSSVKGTPFIGKESTTNVNLFPPPAQLPVAVILIFFVAKTLALLSITSIVITCSPGTIPVFAWIFNPLVKRPVLFMSCAESYIPSVLSGGSTDPNHAISFGRDFILISINSFCGPLTLNPKVLGLQIFTFVLDTVLISAKLGN